MVYGPILCNMNSYPIPVQTPEGKLLIIPTGMAVKGPGFERYIDQHILFLVGSDFTGLIVYETPAPIVGKFQAMAIELEEIKLGRELNETKKELARKSAQAGASMELPPIRVGVMPVEAAPAETKVEQKANNATIKPKVVLPEKVTKDNLPSKSALRNLSKTDLVRICKDLGWEKVENLSRNQLASRLLQIAKD